MTSSPPVRVLIVNDYAVVAAGVAAMLSPYQGRVSVVETRWTGGALPETDVVLYDTFGSLRIDESKAFAAFREIDAQFAVYSWMVDQSLVDRALASGAAGYLSKRLEPEQLVAALEVIHGGDVVVPNAPADDDTRERGSWPGLGHDLSARESEVIALVARGLSNQEIAAYTYLSINSVKTYIRTAYRKMGVTSRSQAVIWALDHGFSPTMDRARYPV